MPYSKMRRRYVNAYAKAIRAGLSREAARAMAQDAAGSTSRRRRPRTTRGKLGIETPHSIHVPPDRMADAMRIRHMVHPTLIGQLMGDPMPGRSALDRRGG